MTRVANVYAQALYDLARSEKLEGQVLQQLQVLSQCFEQTPEYLRLLSVPNLSKEERCRILDNCFQGQTHPYVLNFMKILTEKGYIRQFFGCFAAYQAQYYREKGIVPVCAVTAVALTPEQAKKLSGKLEQITGKSVELTNRVDASCIGGVRLEYDGKCVDDTVQHRLDTIRSLLKNTVL